MVSIEGRPMKTFKVRKNQYGFRWASFWLVGKHAHVAAGASGSKRFGGTRVTYSGSDDVSQYSYQTVRSNNDIPMKNVSVKKKQTAKFTKKGRKNVSGQ